jgi:hypothetical protein
MGQRGAFLQVNLGTQNGPDADGDGLPDAWKSAHGITGNGSGDRDGDGVSDRNEYVAGTNPNDPNDNFHLEITKAGTNVLVSFFARQAAGVGYEGQSRYYGLEYTTNITSGLWFGVSNRTNILGDDTTVSCEIGEPLNPTFYRGKVHLQRP